MPFVTPATAKAIAELERRFPGVKFGIYNRRPISGSSTWSQHSWPNALDIFFTSYGDTSAPHQQMLDKVNRYLKDAADLNIRVRLWRTRNHWDHIHIDFWPMGYGTPSTTRGGDDNRYKARSGKIMSQQELVEEEETVSFDYEEPEDLTQPGEVFHEAWEWGKTTSPKLVNEFTKPTDIVEKQELIVFLHRFQEAFEMMAQVIEDHGHAPGGLILPEEV